MNTSTPGIGDGPGLGELWWIDTMTSASRLPISRSRRRRCEDRWKQCGVVTDSNVSG